MNPLFSYPDSALVVATSKTPDGPFQTVTTKVALSQKGPGDFTLLVDENTQAAYVFYDAWHNNHRVVVEKLTNDYLDSEGQAVPISASGNEAPMIFQRNDYFYLLYGPTCCFCRDGSGAQVWTAKDPMGPWNDEGYDINPKSWMFGSRVIKAQNNFVAQLNGNFVYTADLWTSAPDHLKSHDLQYWAPMTFDDSVQPAKIQQLAWQDEVQI